ncbi:hypothetical protein yfred0001_1910 [Yersinia frederiksenii ATCC 33641]|nr:hypothetical protein yfred0001_1910 [Yersinia frederiksenii ATCC 33641]
MRLFSDEPLVEPQLLLSGLLLLSDLFLLPGLKSVTYQPVPFS